MEINLTFRRSDFEEIFFRNNNGSLLFSETTGKNVKLSALFGILTLAALILCIIVDEYWFILYGLLLVFCFQLVGLFVAIFRLLKWKKQIADYLDRNGGFKVNRIEITDSTFTIVQDTTETIASWGEFKSAEITDEYISMAGIQNYLIPKKSMTPEEYKSLREIISDKLKRNGK